MKAGKIFLLAALLGSVLLFGGIAKADLNYIDIWNLSWDISKGQEVQVIENWYSGEYLRGPPCELRIYGWGPTGGIPTAHEISPVGIGPNKTYLLEFRFEAETCPDNVNNVIYLNHWRTNPLGTEKRNFFMRQDPNSPRKGTSEEDSNIYDLVDLTNYFTENAQIHLPNITSSTPRNPAIYDKWQGIISNYADLAPSVFDGNLPDGKVNWADFAVFASYWRTINHSPNDNWAKGADLNRDGDVNEIDLSLFSEQWLCDPNTIR